MASQPLILAVGALVFGSILGSFLNALTFRYNTRQPLWRAMQGRSRCMRCGHELGMLDLVPVLSWLLLGGKCRYCGSSISIQYPLVEITAALLSLGIALQFISAGNLASASIGAYFFWLLAWMTILFLNVYDWRHMILPMGGLVLVVIFGILSLFFNCLPAETLAKAGLPPVCYLTAPSIWQFLAGPFLAAPLAFLSLVSRGRWMGWGDGILALPLGWLLGIAYGFTALVLAFWIGAIVGIALLAISKFALTLKSEVPFGPFLALGVAIVFFSHFNLFAALGIG